MPVDKTDGLGLVVAYQMDVPNNSVILQSHLDVVTHGEYPVPVVNYVNYYEGRPIMSVQCTDHCIVTSLCGVRQFQ